MNRKKAISVLAAILAVLMIFSLVASIIPAAHAVSQSDIDEIQAQKDNVSGKIKDCQLRIETLQKEKANVLEQKAALEAQNAFANEELELLAREIEVYNGIIRDKALELEDAVDREEDQLQRYRSRIRAMEESGGYNMLALILNSNSFAEFLTAMDDMGRIMENDKALEKKYIEAREEKEEVKAEYEEEKAEYEEKQKALMEEQKELEKQIEDALTTLDSLEEEIKKAEKEREAAEIQMEAAGAAIQHLINQLMEEKRQQAQQNNTPKPAPQTPAEGNNDAGGSPEGGNAGGSTDGGSTDGGSTDGGSGNADNSNSGSDSGSSDQSYDDSFYDPGTSQGSSSFIWPVPCSNTVTSRYGPRIHPITGEVGRMHNGIDIDGFGNEGGAIVAAASGTVTVASYDGGYGNYVIIDHGSDQTLYAHMSGFAVSQGQWVEQGQTIGFLGSTGMSTGTHCHYEMFINGSRVDPASYYSGITFWNC